ncbi:ABC transporter, partial [Singulisphaera rosea]
MFSKKDGSSIESGRLPGPWHDALAPGLDPGELILTWFCHDLDARMRYGEGLLALTDRRLIHAGGGSDSTALDVQSWDLGPELALKSRDRAGV